MKNDALLSISELARFARISRTALIHYDRIGLVHPAERGDNNYRYYSHNQIASTNLISTLQSLGMSLKEIMALAESRTPEVMLDLFSRQSKFIDGEILRLRQSQKLLTTLKKMLEMGLSADEDGINAVEEDEEPVLMGPQINYTPGMTIEEATLQFYQYAMKRDPDVDMNYPVWALFREDRIKRREWNGPDRFYFWMPDGPERKPRGLYVVGYTRGTYGRCGGLYGRMLEYMDENGYEIAGPAWEMYPLNEISVASDDNYLIKISITARRK